MAATENRSVTIKINGKDVANNIRAIEKEFFKLRNEVKKAERGSAEYNQKMQELKKTKAILDQHRKDVGGMRKSWGGMANFLKAQLGPLLAIGTLVNVLRGAFNTIKDFGQAQANLASVLGKTREETTQLTEDAKRLGAATSFTATEVSNLQTEYAKLGFTQQEIINVTEATLALAAATNTDLAEAATVAGSTLRAFGLDASEMGRVTDVMAKSFSSSALDMEKWKESMKTAAPLAKAAGISVEETAAMLGKLADSGISGSMAGTSLKQVFNELSKSGKPLGDTIADVRAQLEAATSPAERLAIANDLVGDRAQAALLILAEQSDGIGVLAGTLRDAGGAAQEMADTQLNTLDGRLKILASAWDGLILQFSEGESTMMGIVDLITGIINAYQEVVSDLQDSFADLNSSFGGLADSMGIFQEEGESTIQVMDFVAMAVKMGVLPFKLMITAIEGVVKGFRAILEGGKAAFDFLSDFKLDNGLGAFKESLKDFSDVGYQLADDLKKPFIQFFEDPEIGAAAGRGGAIAAKNYGAMTVQQLKQELTSVNELLKNEWISDDLKASLEKKANEINSAIFNAQAKNVSPEDGEAGGRVIQATLERLEAVKSTEIDAAIEIEAAKDTLMNEGLLRRGAAHSQWVRDQVAADLQAEAELNEAKIALAQQVLDTGFQLAAQGISRQEQRDLEALEKKKQAGIISEKEYEQEKLQIQKQAFNKKKLLDIAQAIINGALAITKVTAQTGVLAPLAIPSIIASTAGQVALIASQKFAEGGLFNPLDGPAHSEGGMPVIDPKSGQVRAELEGGEMIIRKSSVNAATMPVLRSINQSGTVPSINFGAAQENIRFEKGGIFAGGGSAENNSMILAYIQEVREWQREFTVSLPLRNLEDEQARKARVEKLAGVAA